MIPHSRPDISKIDIEMVSNALRSRCLSQGKVVSSLEVELSAMFDDAYVVAVSSGTAALYLSLVALNIGKEQKVIIPSYTCNSLYSAVCFAGGLNVCADIPDNSLSITADTVKPVLDNNSNIGAIIAPHTCGYLADIEGILEYGIPVIEDCAQAVGGYYPDGRRIGTKGDISILSFFATKLLPAGEGGACITRDKNLAEKIRMLRNCDEQEPMETAFNFKMSDIHAALALAKLKDLSSSIEKRSMMARKYDEVFVHNAFNRKFNMEQPVCFRYILSTEDANIFIDKSQMAGIMCKRPIWRPLHYFVGGSCPKTEIAHNSLVSVPLYQGLTDTEITEICDTLSMLLN